jgi:hypothetical protein
MSMSWLGLLCYDGDCGKRPENETEMNCDCEFKKESRAEGPVQEYLAAAVDDRANQEIIGNHLQTRGSIAYRVFPSWRETDVQSKAFLANGSEADEEQVLGDFGDQENYYLSLSLLLWTKKNEASTQMPLTRQRNCQKATQSLSLAGRSERLAYPWIPLVTFMLPMTHWFFDGAAFQQHRWLLRERRRFSRRHFSLS